MSNAPVRQRWCAQRRPRQHDVGGDRQTTRQGRVRIGKLRIATGPCAPIADLAATRAAALSLAVMDAVAAAQAGLCRTPAKSPPGVAARRGDLYD
ncbi:MAG: hypothetical protein MZV70_01830 [Desulfobacterales bacterium]|nr:hypothetical protein [Desulfobacterales bacterium]